MMTKLNKGMYIIFLTNWDFDKESWFHENYTNEKYKHNSYNKLKFCNAMFGNNDLICKFGIGLNLLFSKFKILKFGFRLNPPLFVKYLKLRNWEWLLKPYHSQIPHILNHD